MPNTLGPRGETQTWTGEGKDGKRQVLYYLPNTAVKGVFQKINSERIGYIIHPDDTQ